MEDSAQQQYETESRERVSSFTYDHLPESATIKSVSKRICDLVRELDAEIVAGPEWNDALRAFMQAKDCACRASLKERMI